MTLPEDIKIGRLRKRIDKLTQQREFWRKRCEDYAAVLNLHPAIEYHGRKWAEIKAERARVRELEQRVEEQALLIQKLSKGAPE